MRVEAVIKILFVCLGNICRSPTAEGVVRHLVQKEGLIDRVLLELQTMKDLGVKYVYFEDDSLFAKKKRAYTLFRAVAEHPHGGCR